MGLFSRRTRTPTEKKDRRLPMHRIVLGLAMSIACSIAVQAPAFSEEYRGSYEQQMACTPDVWRLCFDQIPDTNRIVTCLRQNTPQLSGPCRAVFESNASAPEQAPPPPKRRNTQPRTYDNEPTYDNQYRSNQYQ
jgi:hypothetical protein